VTPDFSGKTAADFSVEATMNEVANVLTTDFRDTRETAVEAFLTKQSTPMK